MVALGAAAGLALGIALADRTGGVKGLKAKIRRRRRERAQQLDAEAGYAPTSTVEASIAMAEDYAALYDEAPGESELAEDDDSTEASIMDASADAPAITSDDIDLEGRVLEAFRNDPILRGRPIDIGAIGDGLIELTGWVHSPAEVAHALTLARGVPSVAHVVDRLTIRGTDLSRKGHTAVSR
jgi:hypothetical protein